MAIRIALPPSLLAALASRAIRCSALDVLDVGAASIQRPLLPLQFPDQPLHLRIGYLSSDFHRHKVGKAPPAARHLDRIFLPKDVVVEAVSSPRTFACILPSETLPSDTATSLPQAGLLRRAMFQEPSPSHPLSIHLFYTGTVEDDYTAQLRRASSSRSFTVLSRQDLGLAASLLNSASLHVLVDLNTHNRGGHTALVSLQPAPVIICYPDYPGTSGMANSALLVTDLIVTPPEMRLFATERLLLLPSSFFVADHASSLPPPPAPHAPRKAPGAGGPARVVCAPNAAGKLDLCGATAVRGALRGWEGELWIGPAHSERARERFARAVGVSSGRVHVMRREKRDAHVERLRGCEVSLDSMSLSAIATGADAVWAGSVLVASPGESFGSRVSASLLLNSGRGAGVCRDADDYAAVGMALVGGAWARAKEGFPWDGSAGLFDEEAWMRGWYAGVRSAYDGATASGGVGIEHCEISSGGWKPSHVVAAAG